MQVLYGVLIRNTMALIGAAPAVVRHVRRAVAVAAIARQTGSRYLITNAQWPPVINLPAGLRALGWHVDRLARRGSFEIFRLTPPSPR